MTSRVESRLVSSHATRCLENGEAELNRIRSLEGQLVVGEERPDVKRMGGAIQRKGKNGR